MTLIQGEYVLYHLTKAVGLGHASKVRDFRKACSAIQVFITKHTIVAEFEVCVPNWIDSSISQKIIDKGTVLFGSLPIECGIFDWKLPISMLTDALEFAFREKDSQENILTPVYLHLILDWQHLPTDLHNLNASFYSKGSRLLIHSLNGRNIFFQPTLLFPLAYDSPKLKQFLSQLEPDLPFKLRDDCFYRVTPKKTGTGEKLVKLHKGWRIAN